MHKTIGPLEIRNVCRFKKKYCSQANKGLILVKEEGGAAIRIPGYPAGWLANASPPVPNAISKLASWERM